MIAIRRVKPEEAVEMPHIAIYAKEHWGIPNAG